MKITSGVTLIALATLAAGQSLQRCSGSHTRPNAARMSSTQWQSIATVLRQMNEDGWIARFGQAHDQLFSQVHGNTVFFPFHRRFVLEFENVARRYDPSFVVPYFDATESYRDPASHPLLTAGALGTNGQSTDRCLVNGVQANTQLSYPSRHCLRRNYNNGNSINPWYAPEIITSYIQTSQTLADFRENIEYSIHGAVHLGLAGEMDTGYAAHDFTFMLHHANIDRLWWEWQSQHNSYMTYDGSGPSGPAQLSDAIPSASSIPFNGDRVSSMMVLGYGEVCYNYDTSPAPPSSYPGGAAGAPQQNGPAAAAQQPFDNQSTGGRPSNDAEQQPAANQGSRGRPSNTAAPQQQQQQPAARPFLPSGSSNLASRILESTGLSNALGGNVGRFFPSFGSGLFRVHRRGYKEKPVTGCGDPIPFPPRLTPEWIAMHKFDPDRVEEFHKNACQIVEVLNNSTYTSPY